MCYKNQKTRAFQTFLAAASLPSPPIFPNLSRTRLFQTDHSRSNIIVFKTLAHLVKPRPDTRHAANGTVVFLNAILLFSFCNG